MQDLIELFRHNAWANARVFDVVVSLEPELLEAEAAGTRDSVTGTLGHLVRVEDAYLAMTQRRALETLGPSNQYMARGLAWFASRAREVGAEYLDLLESTPADALELDLGIPWFNFPVSAREGLRQTLTHSAQHRSQVLSWLSAKGVHTPDLDYVLMLKETRAP
ncbi:MAG: DinB family protein [Chloroflexota bacterium]|nr:DinB family protein [Chloroflexota bacterium]